MKKRTINVKPFHCEIECGSTGFVLLFVCDGDKTIRLHMEYWLIGYIARDLWKAVRKQRGMVEENERMLTGDVK